MRLHSPIDQIYQELAELRRLQEQQKTIEVPLPSPVAPFLALPGLVGFWPMSSVDLSSGDPYDISGQGRRMTTAGNPTYNIYNSLVAYADLDGTGDHFELADSTDLDITGTETIYASGVRGLTMGGWFWLDTVASSGVLIGKNTSTGNQRSYVLFYNSATGFNRGQVSSNGTATTTVDSTSTAVANTWYFLVQKYIPSTSLSLFENGTKYTNTTSIPASIFSGTSVFRVGDNGDGTAPLNGRAALCFLCGNALPDEMIAHLFNTTRPYFGV